MVQLADTPSPQSATVGLHLIAVATTHYNQGDHSPDNMKFPDNSMTFPWLLAPQLSMLRLTHYMHVLVLLSVFGVGMQQCTNWNQTEMHKLSKVKNGCKYAANNKQF